MILRGLLSTKAIEEISPYITGMMFRASERVERLPSPGQRLPPFYLSSGKVHISSDTLAVSLCIDTKDFGKHFYGATVPQSWVISLATAAKYAGVTIVSWKDYEMGKVEAKLNVGQAVNGEAYNYVVVNLILSGFDYAIPLFSMESGDNGIVTRLPSTQYVRRKEPGVGVTELEEALEQIIREVTAGWGYDFKASVKGRPPIRKPDSMNCTVGTDAEYVIVDQKLDVLHAPTEFFQDTQTGAIGTDGNVEIFEVRPAPHKNPLRVVANLSSLLRDVHRVLPSGIDIFGGGGAAWNSSTGVHIHFSDLPFRADEYPVSETGTAKGHILQWFNQLMFEPLRAVCKSWSRGNPNYGHPYDIRSKYTTRDFAHDGFEWRALPQVFISPEFASAILCTAKCIMDTYCTTEEEHEIATKDDIATLLRSLEGYPKYKKYIERFITIISSNKKVDLNVPILSNFFERSSEKDAECDIAVMFEPNGHEGLDIRGYIGYSPQKLADAIVFYGSSKPYIRLSYVGLEDKERAIHRKLQAFFLKRYGCQIVSIQPQTSYVRGLGVTSRRVITVGLPSAFVRSLSSRNVGSRNGVKLFSQELLKEIW